jgi:hypothetical protein
MTFRRCELRPILGFWIGLCLVALPLSFAHADPADDSLRLYAVDIWHDPPQSWGPGRGVYLGNGLVLTAAHVVGSAARTSLSVRSAAMDLPAKAIKEGNVESVDLTLLSIDEQKLPIYLQMRRMPLCEKNPWPGEPVIVAVPEETARSYVISPLSLPFRVARKFSTLIRDVGATENSGSGVFDTGNKCLLGIISRKFFVRQNSGDAEVQEKDIAKYFVPASTIRAFIPNEYRF